MKQIKATLISGKVTSNSAEAKSLMSKSNFGEKLGDKILYSNTEALFLLENKKIFIEDSRGKTLSIEEFLKKIRKTDKEFENKYTVFNDLRSKGYIVKTALKFGADFRVYEKNNKHSKWIVFVSNENKKLSWQDFASKNRVAHSTKKKLLIAIIDEENDVSYYESNWTRT